MDEFEGMVTQSELDSTEVSAEVKGDVEVKPAEGGDGSEDVRIGLDVGAEGGEKTVVAEVQDKQSDELKDMFGNPGHTPAGVQERFNKLTKRNRELEDRVSSIEAEFKAYRDRMEPKKMLTKSDFLDSGRTEEDYINYVAEMRASEMAKKAVEDNEYRKKAEEEYRRYQKNEDDARKAFPDFDEVMNDSDSLRGTQKVADAFRRHEMGAFIHYSIMKSKSLKDMFRNAPNEEAKINFVNSVGNRLIELRNNAMKANVQKSTPPAEKPVVQTAQPTHQPQIREPGEFNSKGAKKPIDPSNCSMEEWMENGF